MEASSAVDCFPRMLKVLALIPSAEGKQTHRQADRQTERQTGREGDWEEGGEIREGGREGKKNLDGNKKT